MNSNHTCLVVICTDSSLKKDKNYLQVFLKEFKYTKKKMIRHIVDKLEKSTNDSDEE